MMKMLTDRSSDGCIVGFCDLDLSSKVIVNSSHGELSLMTYACKVWRGQQLCNRRDAEGYVV